MTLARNVLKHPPETAEIFVKDRGLTFDDAYFMVYRQPLRYRLAYLKKAYMGSNNSLCWELGDKQRLIELCDYYKV